MHKGILIIGGYPPPFGGISSHLQYLAPYLALHGYDVRIISPGTGKAVEKIDEFITVYRIIKKEKILKIIFYLPRTIKEVMKFRTINLKAWKESLNIAILTDITKGIINKNKNIVIISAYHLFPEGFIGALLSEKFHIPLVTTNFGEIYADPNFYTERLSTVKYICEKSSKILSSSQHCAGCYKLLGIEPIVEVIPYGIDIKHFSSENRGEIIRQKLGIGKQDRVVLFVGRMIRDMGLHTLLAAIPLVLRVRGNAKFVIAGAKGGLFDSALKLQAQYKNNVFVISDVSFKELPLYYASSAIVTAPTPNERACMGMAIKEAMASGKPVIAAKSGGIPEAVIDGETGILILPESPQALSRAILNLIDDEDTIIRMGKAGRKRAEALFDKDITNQKICKIFQEVMKKK